MCSNTAIVITGFVGQIYFRAFFKITCCAVVHNGEILINSRAVISVKEIATPPVSSDIRIKLWFCLLPFLVSNSRDSILLFWWSLLLFFIRCTDDMFRVVRSCTFLRSHSCVIFLVIFPTTGGCSITLNTGSAACSGDAPAQRQRCEGSAKGDGQAPL